MIRNNLQKLIDEKAKRDKRPKIPIREISHQIGLSANTLYLWLRDEGVNQVNLNTLNALCEYFDCQVGDLLEYQPDKLN